MAEDIQYEEKAVRTIRGTEARSIEKWQKDGWELVAKDEGRLRTELTFRRPKPKTPWRLIAAGGGLVVVLIAFSLIMGAMTGDGEGGPSAAPADSASPTFEQQVSATPEAEESATPSEEAEPSETATEEVLTVENNEDLAALLAAPAESPLIEEFAAKYGGDLIEFDASIGAMANHGDYDTRYDILISAGDYSETVATGPNFQFLDVNTVSDLHYVDDIDDRPETIGVGDNLRVVARVLEFNPDTLLFQLDPVSTQFR